MTPGWYVRNFGFQGLYVGAVSKIFRGSKPLRIYSKTLSRWLTLRTKTSDLAVYEKVITNDEYRLPESFSPDVIIDAGANNGLSVLAFNVKYPTAKIIAIEPEASNFRLLSMNVKGIDNIFPLFGAVWSENGQINLTTDTNDQSGHRLESSSTDGALVPGYTLDTVMNKFGIETVSLLKVDVEGAEKEIFESADKWIDSVDLLVIELHDRFKEGCAKSVQVATSKFTEKWVYGENNFYRR